MVRRPITFLLGRFSLFSGAFDVSFREGKDGMMFWWKETAWFVPFLLWWLFFWGGWNDFWNDMKVREAFPKCPETSRFFFCIVCPGIGMICFFWKICLLFIFLMELLPRKLTWQWNINHWKMYFLLKMGIFHCRLSFRGGKQRCFRHFRTIKPGNLFGDLYKSFWLVESRGEFQRFCIGRLLFTQSINGILGGFKHFLF